MDNNNLTEPMKRLLYIIAEYTKLNNEYGKLVIKDLPLKALIYYGIISNVLNYDYAPMSVMYMDNRRYLNVSQEGEDDLNDLRDLKLLNKIRIATRSHNFIYTYSLTDKGVNYLDKISPETKKIVDDVFKCKCGDTYKIKVSMEGIFFTCDKCNENIDSGITDIEDVSYKSKPIKITTILTKNKQKNTN